jgi:hypothetical protein
MWYDAIFLKYRTLKTGLVSMTQRAATSFVGYALADDPPNDQTTVRPGAAAGADLTDANVTIDVSQGFWRKMPDTTLSTTRTIRLSASGAAAGDWITITLGNQGARQAVIVDDTSSGTLCHLGASGFISTGRFQFNGTAWELHDGGNVAT